MKTPCELGFRWPAEWESHEATMISWPRREGISFPGSFDRVMPTFVAMVRALARSEKVYVNVRDAEHEKEVRGFFTGDLPAEVYFFRVPTAEPWCRDHGPIVLLNHRTRERCVVDWDYNAWGGKYAPWDEDDAVPKAFAERFSLTRFVPGMVLEGGSIDGNGEGTILTSESCLLNPNRNPNLSREQIETRMKHFLGIEQVLWLGDGIEGDDTDGHIDDLTRFVSRNEVVTMIEPDTTDANHEPLKKNLAMLQTMKLSDGTSLKVHEVPMPKGRVREGTRLPMSYANFYIANKAVLLPVFGDPNDKVAKDLLGRLFPTREIVAIDCTELIWGLGAFHCLTQQIPASA